MAIERTVETNVYCDICGEWIMGWRSNDTGVSKVWASYYARKKGCKDSGQEKGGYEKGTSAKNLNFFICPVTTPIAVTKQDIMRIFDPTTNQKLNAWQMDYRRFHDMWILDNKLDSIYLSIQEAKV